MSMVLTAVSVCVDVGVFVDVLVAMGDIAVAVFVGVDMPVLMGVLQLHRIFYHEIRADHDDQ